MHALPAQAGIGLNPPSIGHRPSAHHYRPKRIAPVIHPALQGEGVWRATFGRAAAAAAGAGHELPPRPGLPTAGRRRGVDRPHAHHTWLYPGLSEPAVTPALPRADGGAADALRPRLVATFNSGFKLSDSGGGFADRRPHLRAAEARPWRRSSRYRNGRVDVIVVARRARRPGPTSLYARQNLPLIVNNGRPNPNLSDGPEWGATLGNAVLVWRSAVGVDRHGNLIYAAANDQTVGSLAAIMIRAGAVRAMELDINTYWTSFITL